MKQMNIGNQIASISFSFIQDENEKQEIERKIPLLKDIEIKNKLGEGNFGVVMFGIWENQEIAMKSIGSNKIRRLIKESNTLRSLQHPNVIRFYGIFKDDKEEYYLCIEFVSGGSLDDYLKKNKLSEKELLKLTISGLKGLKYLERNRIIHRDIAARNFLDFDFGTGRN